MAENEEQPSGEKTHPTTRSRLNDFLDYTSTQGLPHVKRVRHPVWKAVWVVLIVAGAILMIQQLAEVIAEHMSHPYNVIIDEGFDHMAEFPLVTVCNLNPYK